MLAFIIFIFLYGGSSGLSDETAPASVGTTRALNNSVNVRTVLFRDADNCRTLLLATYDALGGYLHAIVIPILNEAYYAGNVDYMTASNLHTLLGIMMDYLGTNGNSWAAPCDMRRIPTKVAPLPIRLCKTEEACNAFVIATGLNKTGEECLDSAGQPMGDTKIQIPFLDDNAYPSAIAVPLREHPLFSLMSECAVNIVPKYYILAMRCLSSQNYTNKDIVAFNKQLHRWIIATVVPHLHEMERWYPGFGSIMRVVETMNQRGLASTEVIKQDIRESNRSVCVDISANNICGGIGLRTILMWILFIFIIIVVILILIWLIRSCLACIRSKRSGEAEAKDKFTNTLVNLYCGIKGRPPYSGESPAKSRPPSSGGTYEGEESSDEEYEETE